MPDMLVKLYDLPEVSPLVQQLAAGGIVVRHAMAYEKHLVVGWVRNTFDEGWASECEVAFSNHPVSCFIAVEAGRVVGFACHDSTCKNFFGPTGVSESHRGRGIGKVLFLACLHDMAAQGYAYAIIGGVGPAEFYANAAGATIIEGSTPGIYRDPLGISSESSGNDTDH
jgi:GNAT superfamily N-acetyltransferase